MSKIEEPIKIEYVEIKQEELSLEIKQEQEWDIKEELTDGTITEDYFYEPKTEKFNCTICNKTFSQNFALIIHQRLHNLINLFKCNVCEQTFTDVRYLAAHKKSHTEITCNTCNETFTDKTSYNMHEKNHNKNYINCPKCDKSFKDHWHLSSHVTRIHAFKRPNKCPKCNKIFKLLSDLKRHKTIHTGEKAIKCNICNKVFIDLNSLNKHKSEIHLENLTKVFTFKCITCNEIFENQQELTDHHETLHNSFKCDECSKTFKCEINLVNHKKVHVIKNSKIDFN